MDSVVFALSRNFKQQLLIAFLTRKGSKVTLLYNLTVFLGNLIHKDSDEAKDQAQGIVQTEPQESTGIYVFLL